MGAVRGAALCSKLAVLLPILMGASISHCSMGGNDMKTQNCVCSKQRCWRNEEEKIPKYCQGNKFLDEIEVSKGEYQKTSNIRIYEAACVVGAENDGFRPRIESHRI